MRQENIKVLIMNKLYPISMWLITFFTFILTGVIFYYQVYKKEMGYNNPNIQIIKWELEPHKYFLDKNLHVNNKTYKNDTYATASLFITLKNFSNKPIHITSFKSSIKGKTLKYSSGSGVGILTLNKNPNKSPSILIEPGEIQKIQLPKGINLKPIMHFFNLNEFKNAPYSNIQNKPFIHYVPLFEKFNKELFAIYKFDNINIKLFTEFKKLLKEDTVVFSNGAELFSNNGQFQHDTFLAKVRAIQNEEYNINMNEMSKYYMKVFNKKENSL